MKMWLPILMFVSLLAAVLYSFAITIYNDHKYKQTDEYKKEVELQMAKEKLERMRAERQRENRLREIYDEIAGKTTAIAPGESVFRYDALKNILWYEVECDGCGAKKSSTRKCEWCGK
jgi:hypothetical protein